MIFDRKRVVSLRENLGLSKREFARRLKTSRQRVINWEAGDSKPNIESLCEMCNVFGVDPNYFFVKKLVSKPTKKDGGEQ